MKVEACVCINDEDLVVTGDVRLPWVLDFNVHRDAEVEILSARTDVPRDQKSEPRNHYKWCNADEERAKDSLVDAAVDRVKEEGLW